MIKSTAEMLKKGYLLFPKVLFEEQMKKTKGATGYFDAFILVLTHVNYSTTECTVKHYTFESAGRIGHIHCSLGEIIWLET